MSVAESIQSSGVLRFRIRQVKLEGHDLGLVLRVLVRACISVRDPHFEECIRSSQQVLLRLVMLSETL